MAESHPATPPEAPEATQGEPTAPERIWVTYDEKETPVAVETDDRDACKTDVEYIRADLVEALRERVKELEGFLSPFKDLKSEGL